uniref:Uncharacterized protein n=1 Tax=Rhizophora mucronata TaxID=61149 RepID=A0A2P2R560_RHIMU
MYLNMSQRNVEAKANTSLTLSHLN